MFKIQLKHKINKSKNNKQVPRKVIKIIKYVEQNQSCLGEKHSMYKNQNQTYTSRYTFHENFEKSIFTNRT